MLIFCFVVESTLGCYRAFAYGTESTGLFEFIVFSRMGKVFSAEFYVFSSKLSEVKLSGLISNRCIS